ncbi:unnamed protein product [Calypogeia fissa]
MASLSANQRTVIVLSSSTEVEGSQVMDDVDSKFIVHMPTSETLARSKSGKGVSIVGAPSKTSNNAAPYTKLGAKLVQTPCKAKGNIIKPRRMKEKPPPVCKLEKIHPWCPHDDWDSDNDGASIDLDAYKPASWDD